VRLDGVEPRTRRLRARYVSHSRLFFPLSFRGVSPQPAALNKALPRLSSGGAPAGNKKSRAEPLYTEIGAVLTTTDQGPGPELRRRLNIVNYAQGGCFDSLGGNKSKKHIPCFRKSATEEVHCPFAYCGGRPFSDK